MTIWDRLCRFRAFFERYADIHIDELLLILSEDGALCYSTGFQ